MIAIAVWARAIGLARSGNPDATGPEIQRLRQLEQQLRNSATESGEYWADQVGILSLEASAWTAQAEGRASEARNLLQKAADEEDATEKLPVTPGPIVPAREQFADLLLQQNHADLAAKEYRIALSNAPNRRGAVAGLTIASETLAKRASKTRP